MDIETFWDLVERSRTAVSSTKDQAESLVDLLEELEVEEIIAFERFFFSCESASYRHDLWLACYLLSGGYASDDGFKDFRSYLISRGREVFESALHDPDSLAELIPIEDEAPGYEVFAYSASNAYTKKTGGYFDEDGVDVRTRPEGFVMWEFTRPGGEALTFADAEKHLPKLKRRFDDTMRRRLSAAKEDYSSPDPVTRGRALWDFYHFSSHSSEALSMLQLAAEDESPEIQATAAEYLETYRRRTGQK